MSTNAPAHAAIEDLPIEILAEIAQKTGCHGNDRAAVHMTCKRFKMASSAAGLSAAHIFSDEQKRWANSFGRCDHIYVYGSAIGTEPIRCDSLKTSKLVLVNAPSDIVKRVRVSPSLRIFQVDNHTDCDSDDESDVRRFEGRRTGNMTPLSRLDGILRFCSSSLTHLTFNGVAARTSTDFKALRSLRALRCLGLLSVNDLGLFLRHLPRPGPAQIRMSLQSNTMLYGDTDAFPGTIRLDIELAREFDFRGGNSAYKRRITELVASLPRIFPCASSFGFVDYHGSDFPERMPSDKGIWPSVLDVQIRAQPFMINDDDVCAAFDSFPKARSLTLEGTRLVIDRCFDDPRAARLDRVVLAHMRIGILQLAFVLQGLVREVVLDRVHLRDDIAILSDDDETADSMMGTAGAKSLLLFDCTLDASAEAPRRLAKMSLKEIAIVAGEGWWDVGYTSDSEDEIEDGRYADETAFEAWKKPNLFDGTKVSLWTMRQHRNGLSGYVRPARL